MLQINYSDFKKILKIEIADSSINKKQLKELALKKEKDKESKYKEVFSEDFLEKNKAYVDKKLFNQNRFLLEVDEQDIKEYLTFLSNLSFTKQNFEIETMFKPQKMKITEKDANIAIQMIQFNVTHSLKTINTTFSNHVYIDNLKESDYGIDSSVATNNDQKLPFSTTEGNASVNSKFPLFLYNFIYKGEICNVIKLIKTERDLVEEVLLNYIDKSLLYLIFEAVDKKEPVEVNGNLGYQTIIDVSNEDENQPKYINISPIISIEMLHKIGSLNNHYANNVIKGETNTIVIAKNKDGSDRVKPRFFLTKEGYKLGGAQPQNVNPYYLNEAGNVLALKSSIPVNFSDNTYENDMNKIQNRKSLFSKAYLNKEERKKINEVLSGLYNVEKKSIDGSDTTKKVIKRLMVYVPRLINELLYLQSNYTREDFKEYLTMKTEKQDIKLEELQDFTKLNENEQNIIFGYQSNEAGVKMRKYVQEELDKHIGLFLSDLNIKEINANYNVFEKLKKELVNKLKRSLGV